MNDETASLLGLLALLGVGALAFFKGRIGSVNSSEQASEPDSPAPIPVPIPEPTLTATIDLGTTTPELEGGIVFDRPGPDDAPKGIRNNNPGNIEAGIDNWQGAIGDDGRFIIFRAPEWGIRAMGKILINYQRLHGLNTIRGIVSRWAPPSENPTERYIESVSQHTGIAHNLELDVESVLPILIPAIIRQENGVNGGQQWYSSSVIETGVALI